MPNYRQAKSHITRKKRQPSLNGRKPKNAFSSCLLRRRRSLHIFRLGSGTAEKLKNIDRFSNRPISRVRGWMG